MVAVASPFSHNRLSAPVVIAALMVSIQSAAAQPAPPEPLQARVGATQPPALASPDAADLTADALNNDFPPGVITFLPRRSSSEIDRLVATDGVRPQVALLFSYQATYFQGFMRREVGTTQSGVIDLTVSMASAEGAPLTSVSGVVGCRVNCTEGGDGAFGGQSVRYLITADRLSADQVSISSLMLFGDRAILIDKLKVTSGEPAAITLPDGKTVSLTATIRPPTQAEFDLPQPVVRRVARGDGLSLTSATSSGGR